MGNQRRYDLFMLLMDSAGLGIFTVMGVRVAWHCAENPSLYLLDEVTAGMDPVFRIEFFRLLQEVIAEEKASILMTSHIEEEMHRKMDYIGILEQGRLISFGESAQ